MKNKIVIGVLVLAVIMLISGATILAVATGGTQDDPLITLSYLTNIFRPRVMEDVSKAENEAEQRFQRRIAELEAQLAAGQGSGQTPPGAADVFSVVTLTRGQTLICQVGTEIMLRVGTANALGATAPALVNYTSGSTLSSGSALTTNHMYLVTIANNGLTATANTVRVLVRGEYSIEG